MVNNPFLQVPYPGGGFWITSKGLAHFVSLVTFLYSPDFFNFSGLHSQFGPWFFVLLGPRPNRVLKAISLFIRELWQIGILDGSVKSAPSVAIGLIFRTQFEVSFAMEPRLENQHQVKLISPWFQICLAIRRSISIDSPRIFLCGVLKSQNRSNQLTWVRSC